MARKRTIDPDIWEDEAINDLSLPAVMFYIGLISHADDDGRLEWRPKQLRLKIVPGRPEANVAAVEGWMAEIERVGLIRTYDVDGHRYGWHPNWSKHQYVNKRQASKIPPHPDDFGSKKSSKQPEPTATVPEQATPVPPQPTPATWPDATIPLPVPEQEGTAPLPVPPCPVPSVSVSVSESDLRERKDARAKAGQASSPALDLARWFVDSALAAGALPADRGLDREVEVFKQVRDGDDPNALLATYPRAEIELRARRFFAAKNAHEIRLPCTITSLRNAWDWAVVASDAVEATSRDSSRNGARASPSSSVPVTIPRELRDGKHLRQGNGGQTS